MLILLLIIHLVICLLIWCLIRTKRITTKAVMFPAVVVVPVCGVLILFMEEVEEHRKKMGSKKIGLDKMKIEDVRYKRIDVDNSEVQDITVPLEEAILVNDTDTKRRLMLDILQKDPEKYIDLLQRARLADDTELTHYATTTMMEIQSDYEAQIRQLEAQKKRQPGNERVTKKLRKVFQTYINNKLLSGNVLLIYRRKLDAILEELVQKNPENRKYCYDLIENKIELKDFSGLDRRLSWMKENWPDDEKIYQLYINYYRACGEGPKIQELLEEMNEKNVYLSNEGKKWFAFWSHEGADV